MAVTIDAFQGACTTTSKRNDGGSAGGRRRDREGGGETGRSQEAAELDETWDPFPIHAKVRVTRP